jgi:hypothetical protein
MNPTRRKLWLRDADELHADILNLRKGYTQAGSWNLPQVCWHLNAVIARWTSTGPPLPLALLPNHKEVLAHTLATGMLPKINAPEAIIPPATATDDDIDKFLDSLERFKSFRGPFARSRLFGEIPFDDYMRLHYIHASHHLSFLIPTT